MTDYDEIARGLRSRLKELTGRAEAVEDELRHPLDADSEEQATDLADDEALAGMDTVFRQEIAEIRDALLRIEKGTYGTCASCGAAISRRRLEVQPTAARCIACA